MALHFNEDASFVPLPTKVPNLTELAYTLSFGKFCNRSYYELADSTHHWRRQYRCDDGTLGHTLLDWKSALVREKLRIMTLRYLDDAGYGQRWWPQSTDAKDLKWQYNKDHDRILDTMMMFFWKQNDNQSRNGFYLQQKKVKVPKVGEEASMSHESGSPVPNTPGQHTFYLQPTRVTINDHTIVARQTGAPAIDETPNDSQVQPPLNSSARKSLEKRRIHEPPAALSHPSSLTSPQHGADLSIQEEYSNVQTASTGRLRNKLSKSWLITRAESPTTAEDIIRSRDYDVRPKIDPSRVVLKYRKLTDKSQLEVEGSGITASPSSEPQSETLSTPDLPSLTKLFMLPELQAIDLEDVQGQQDHKGAKGDEALEDNQMEDVVDDRPGSALRPDRGDEIPVDDRADQIIRSNRDDLGANDCHLDDALNRDPGDRSLDERRSSVFEEHEESFNSLRRSSRAKRPRIIIQDNFLSDDQDSEDEDQGVVTESSEPSPKRRKESKKTKQPPYTLIPKASSTSKNTRRGRKKKLSWNETAKKVEDRIQTTDLTDPPLSNFVTETDKNSDPYSALFRTSPTPNNSRGGPHSEEAVENNLREPKRRLNVSFVIIHRRNALTVKQSWPEGKLRGKSVDFLFDAVSRICQRTNIEQINCTLYTSRTEYIAILQRGDNESFLRMERNFTKEISKAISTNANDGKEIEICIEPLGPEEMTAEDRTEVDDIEVVGW